MTMVEKASRMNATSQLSNYVACVVALLRDLNNVPVETPQEQVQVVLADVDKLLQGVEGSARELRRAYLEE